MLPVGFKGTSVSGAGFKGAYFTVDTDFIKVLLMLLIITQLTIITITTVTKD